MVNLSQCCKKYRGGVKDLQFRKQDDLTIKRARLKKENFKNSSDSFGKLFRSFRSLYFTFEELKTNDQLDIQKVVAGYRKISIITRPLKYPAL